MQLQQLEDFDIFCVHAGTASVLKEDPNTKRFKRTLISFNTDTQHAIFLGNPLYQATKQHLADKWLKTMKNERKRLILFRLSLIQLKQDKSFSFSFIFHRF